MKIRIFKSIVSAGVAIAMLQTATADAFLASVKSTGMAATAVSYPLDALSGAYNPAGITNVCSRWDFGISWIQSYQRLRIRDLPDYSEAGFPWDVPALFPLNPSTLNGTRNAAKTDNAYIPEGGFVKHFNPEWCSSDFDFAGGFILYNRNDAKTTYGSAIPVFGTTPPGLDYVHEVASLLLAARWCKMHSIGIAINYNIQRLKVNGLQNFANPLFSVDPENSTNRGYNYSNGVGVILGYQLNWRCLNVGFAWAPKTSMRKFDKYNGFVADHGMFDLPERYVAGISYKFWNKLVVAFDYEYIKWRQIPQFRNPTFPNLDLSATDPDYLLGAKYGAGFGFKNQSYYRCGVEYQINSCFTVRGGFRHTDTPIPPDQTTINSLTLDCLENVGTVGGTWRINQCNEVSFFAAMGMTHEIHGKNSIPATLPVVNPRTGERVNYPINVDTTTSSPLGPYTQANGEVDIKQRRYGVGVAWGRYF